MRCPRAEGRHKIHEGDIEVDECVTGRGRWLGQGERERVHETVERDDSKARGRITVVAAAYEAARPKAGRDGRCPRCAEEMFFERERPDVRERAGRSAVRRGFGASLLSLFGG